MSYVELKDVYKRYQMGEVTITASNGVNLKLKKGNLQSSSVRPVREKPPF